MFRFSIYLFKNLGTCKLLADQVEGATGLKPFNLLLVIRVV